MNDDVDQIPPNQIVLHEDKKYYATAMEVCLCCTDSKLSVTEII